MNTCIIIFLFIGGAIPVLCFPNSVLLQLVLVLPGMGIGAGLGILFGKILGLEEAEKQKEDKCVACLDYDGCAKCITVKNRGSIFRSYLKLEENHDILVKNIPDQLVYTSATVGGITTGGFSTIKGGTQLSLGAKTGDYLFSYKDKYISGSIYSFVLTPSDFAEAKSNSTLSRFCITEDEIKRGNSDYYCSYLKKNSLVFLGRNLSKSEGEYFLDWLCHT